jgi:hypothetical protein
MATSRKSLQQREQGLPCILVAVVVGREIREQKERRR